MSRRIRSIKPEILEDEKTAGLDSQTWRIFVSCFVLADDHGYLRGDAGQIRGALFWGRDDVTTASVRQSLDTLARLSLLSFYSVRGQVYAHITNWSKHQRVDKPGKARIPQINDAEAVPMNGPAGLPGNLASVSRDSRETLGTDLGSGDRGSGTGKGRGTLDVVAPVGATVRGKASKVESKEPSDHQRVIDAYHRAFVAAYDKPPTVKAQQGKQVKDLLRQHAADEVIRRMEILFSGRGPDWLKPPFDLGTLVSQFDKLIEPSGSNGRSHGHARPAEVDDEIGEVMP